MREREGGKERNIHKRLSTPTVVLLYQRVWQDKCREREIEAKAGGREREYEWGGEREKEREREREREGGKRES